MLAANQASIGPIAWRLMSALAASGILAACSSDDPPKDAFESKFAVAITVEDFDINVGQTTSSTVAVLVDGTYWPFMPTPNARLIGFEGLSRIQLGGRGVVIAGELEDDVFRASYARLLPAAPNEQKVEPAVRGKRLEELEAVIEALDVRIQAEEAFMAAPEYAGDREEDTRRLEQMKSELREVMSRKSEIEESSPTD